MQRSLPPATPDCRSGSPGRARCASPPAPTAAATPAAAPRRSWMGPIAGLAAGLGIAALMSHFGLGAEFGNILMMVLLAAAAFFLVRFLMRRFMPSNPATAHGGMQLAGAGAPFPKPPTSFPDERPAQFRGQQAATGRRAGLRRRAARHRGADGSGPPSRRFRRACVRAHRQDDLHPPAGGQRRRRPQRPARLHDARDVRGRQARAAGAWRRGAADRCRSRRRRGSRCRPRSRSPGRERALPRHDPGRRRWRCRSVRRGLASRQAGRRQPRVGDRRHPADGADARRAA